MNTILHSSTSLVHLLAALTALITGTYILFTRKGTTVHRRMGRLYAVSMGILLLTAFQIYYLFGRFGVVHWGAVGSVMALAVGLGSVSLRPFIRSWLLWHYLGMGVSIIGLYASFVVESTYRLFSPIYFWWVTLGLTAVILAIGSFVLYRYLPKVAKAVRSTSNQAMFTIGLPATKKGAPV